MSPCFPTHSIVRRRQICGHVLRQSLGARYGNRKKVKLMTALSDALTNRDGRTMFQCRRCSRPLSGDDIIAQGLRLPDPHETRVEYLEAELIDELDHLDCAPAQRAG